MRRSSYLSDAAMESFKPPLAAFSSLPGRGAGRLRYSAAPPHLENRHGIATHLDAGCACSASARDRLRDDARRILAGTQGRRLSRVEREHGRRLARRSLQGQAQRILHRPPQRADRAAPWWRLLNDECRKSNAEGMTKPEARTMHWDR